MDALFEGCRLGNLALRNRFVRSATWEGMTAEEGEVTEDFVEVYRDLGRGTWGWSS